MPTSEPRRVFGKGPVLKGIDDLAAGLGFPALQQLLTVLENPEGQGLVSLASQLGLASPSTLQHLQQDWFGAWWPDEQPVEPVLRAGLAQAVRLALSDPTTGQPRTEPLPIDALWVSGIGHFEVGLGASAHQVTLVLLTPPVPSAVASGATTPEPVFMVHRGAPRRDEEVISSERGILKTRILRRIPPEQAALGPGSDGVERPEALPRPPASDPSAP